MSQTIEAAAFEARCLEIIDAVASDRQPVIVTKDGRPVAGARSRPLVGAMRGSVLGCEDPFGPAADPADWSALE